MTYRLAIIDDRAEFLHAARNELEGSEFEVVAVGSCGADAVAIAKSGAVHALIVDLRLGDEDGVAVGGAGDAGIWAARDRDERLPERRDRGARHRELSGRLPHEG